MSEKRSNGFRNRPRGGDSSSAYHPYRSKGHGGHGHGSHNRRFSNSSNSSSASNRIISVDEAIKTDRILSIENFSNFERIKDQDEIPFEYSKYIRKHQKAHLRNIFNLHKKEKWIINLINNVDNSNSNTFESLEWTPEINLEYQESFDMKIEESSNEGNLLTGCETRLFPSEPSAQLPIAFSKFVPEFCNQIITMSNIPPHVDKEALESHLKELAPDSEIEITSPNPDKSFYRLAWLKLPDNSIEKVSELVPKLESLGSIEGAKVYFGISSSNFRRFKVTSYIEKSEEELYNLAINLIKSLEKNKEFDESIFKTDENNSFAQLLDKAVIYLRKVHIFCFYCVSKFSCPQEMLTKCGDLHLRKPSEADATKHDQHRLIEKLSALTNFIDNLTELSKDLNVDLDEILTESSIKKVEEGKFRCNHCAKAFKGPEFVLKHLTLKHEEVVKQTQDEIEEFNRILANAPLWLFPTSMIPRYTKIRSKFANNSNQYGSRDSQGSSKSSVSKNSRRSQDYMDWDANVNTNSSTEISYDL